MPEFRLRLASRLGTIVEFFALNDFIFRRVIGVFSQGDRLLLVVLHMLVRSRVQVRGGGPLLGFWVFGTLLLVLGDL